LELEIRNFFTIIEKVSLRLSGVFHLTKLRLSGENTRQAQGKSGYKNECKGVSPALIAFFCLQRNGRDALTKLLIFFALFWFSGQPHRI